MAAYAALLSLMNIINQIQKHPHPPISLHQKHLQSLTENLTFLQDFLERNSSSFSEEEEVLERRITSVAYAAEDVIESHIVEQIHGENISCDDLYEGLERVIQDMDLIKKEVMEIVKEKKMGPQNHQLMSTNSSVSIGSTRPVSRMQNSTIVDFGDILNKVLDKLTGQEYSLQIIPIVGMGGIGKTTLARNIFTHPLIVEHFDILAWVTVSEVYSGPKILSEVLSQVNKGGVKMSDEDELEERVYKTLWGRRYLIVLDDIWSIEAWDEVKSFFPNNKNGSRVMITTRLSNLAFQLSGSHDFHMNFLDDDKSWKLLCEIVFGNEGCPTNLEYIGKKIARNCRGLPLSVIVIGGLLAKSYMTRDYWEYTLRNLNSVINLEDNEYCLQILRMSYKELPIHLKPCFLYMGVFPEDDKISVSKVIELWVAEGILKPIDDNSLEEAAEEYFKELIDRNLILVHELHWNKKTKSCKIHDLLRDLCLREAQKQRFLCVLRSQDPDIPQGKNIQRRICIHDEVTGCQIPSPSLSFRLLRVYSRVDISYIEDISQQGNLLYISISRFSSSCSLFWNLQTLKVDNPFSLEPIIVPFQIWEMPLLRHVMVNQPEFELPDPQNGKDNIVMENLLTLSGISNFKCSEEVVKRIPNIKTLKVVYDTYMFLEEEGLTKFCLNNLGQLQKLKSLRLILSYPIPDLVRSNLVQNLNFPQSLKKLTLRCTKLYWDEVTTKIGSLPCLEVLKLDYSSCIGHKWKTVQGQFCSLKFLLIKGCYDLKKWKMDETHFPRLEHLVLECLYNLEEIPLSVGDIPTLQSIKLKNCSKFAKDSAERIKEEQEDNGNVHLRIHIGKN